MQMLLAGGEPQSPSAAAAGGSVPASPGASSPAPAEGSSWLQPPSRPSSSCSRSASTHQPPGPDAAAARGAEAAASTPRHVNDSSGGEASSISSSSATQPANLPQQAHAAREERAVSKAGRTQPAVSWSADSASPAAEAEAAAAHAAALQAHAAAEPQQAHAAEHAGSSQLPSSLPLVLAALLRQKGRELVAAQPLPWSEVQVRAAGLLLPGCTGARLHTSCRFHPLLLCRRCRC